jgi:hypothetical protein
MFAWIGRLRTLTKRFAAARVVAEALAWHHGERGVAMAEAAAANDRVSDEESRHNRLVATLTAQRHRFLSGLDLPSRYYTWQHWRRRPGQMIVPQDCEWADDETDLRYFGPLFEEQAGRPT